MRLAFEPGDQYCSAKPRAVSISAHVLRGVRPRSCSWTTVQVRKLERRHLGMSAGDILSRLTPPKSAQAGEVYLSSGANVGGSSVCMDTAVTQTYLDRG